MSIQLSALAIVDTHSYSALFMFLAIDYNMTGFMTTSYTETVYNYKHCSDKVLRMIFGFSIYKPGGTLQTNYIIIIG